MLCTGIEGFYIAVRGSVEDYHEPKLFLSDKALHFVKDLIEIEPQHLALKFEAWCVSGLGKIEFISATRIRNAYDVIQIK